MLMRGLACSLAVLSGLQTLGAPETCADREGGCTPIIPFRAHHRSGQCAMTYGPSMSPMSSATCGSPPAGGSRLIWQPGDGGLGGGLERARCRGGGGWAAHRGGVGRGGGLEGAGGGGGWVGPPPGAGRGWSVSLASGEQQVLPVHDCRGGAVVVAAGEDSEIVVEGCGLFGVVGDAPVGGDGRSVAGLEVVAEVFGAGEEADPECFPLCRHVGYRAAEQRADVVLAA